MNAVSRPISRQTSRGAEQDGTRLLAADLAPRIDALQAHVGTESASGVPSRSSLAGDDQASKPFQVSHAAWYAAVHSVDNLQALRALTVRGREPELKVMTYPYAAYPLLRAAIENASAAVWMLAPSSRNTRLLRRFRLLLQDARMGDEATKLMGERAAMHERRLVRVAEVIEDRPGLTLSACKKAAGYRLIVREAAEGLGQSADTAEVLWRLLSGLTHGDMWAGLTVTDRDEVAVSADGTVVTMSTTSSLSNIANMTAYVVTLAEAAVGLYDQRRTPL